MGADEAADGWMTSCCLSFSGSELQIALVALFSEMLYRFPDVVVAQVTRESVQQAIANGITAQQVGSSPLPRGWLSVFVCVCVCMCVSECMYIFLW